MAPPPCLSLFFDSFAAAGRKAARGRTVPNCGLQGRWKMAFARVVAPGSLNNCVCERGRTRVAKNRPLVLTLLPYAVSHIYSAIYVRGGGWDLCERVGDVDTW